MVLLCRSKTWAIAMSQHMISESLATGPGAVLAISNFDTPLQPARFCHPGQRLEPWRCAKTPFRTIEAHVPTPFLEFAITTRTDRTHGLCSQNPDLSSGNAPAAHFGKTYPVPREPSCNLRFLKLCITVWKNRTHLKGLLGRLLFFVAWSLETLSWASYWADGRNVCGFLNKFVETLNARDLTPLVIPLKCYGKDQWNGRGENHRSVKWSRCWPIDQWNGHDLLDIAHRDQWNGRDAGPQISEMVTICQKNDDIHWEYHQMYLRKVCFWYKSVIFYWFSWRLQYTLQNSNRFASISLILGGSSSADGSENQSNNDLLKDRDHFTDSCFHMYGLAIESLGFRS